MPLVTGPELTRAKRELIEWYQAMRDRLIKAVEEQYPYGSRQLSPAEQLQRYLDMTPEQHQLLEMKLMERHRGKPNQRELVEADLTEYTTRMTRMMGGVR